LANQIITAPVVADVDVEEGPDGPSFAAAEQSIKIECGCCFDDGCSFVSRTHMSNNISNVLFQFQITMIQCKDGHLFCRDCVTAQAGTAVGSRQRVSLVVLLQIKDKCSCGIVGYSLHGWHWLQTAIPCD
jgi:hypothetical protein